MTRLAQSGVAYARHGWYVFPLVPRDKRPHARLAPHGFHDASTDAGVIDAWWRESPDSNVGLHPAPSGLVVLDVDGPAGLDTARALGLAIEDHDATLTVITGRAGGLHTYYRHPGFPVGNRALGPGLDVRGDAGYVILPPSIHPSGAVYRWLGRLADIQPLPANVLELLRAAQLEPADDANPASREPPAALDDPTLARRVAAYVDKLPWGIPAGAGRNSVAYRFAAWLVRDLGLTRAVAWEWLRQWNARACRPPLGARELGAVLTSAARNGRRAVGSGIGR